MKRLSIVILSLLVITGFTFAQSITVTSPHSGDTWYKGNSYNITWTKTGTMDANVKITLYDPPGTNLIHVITMNTPNDGSYNWTIPNSILVGNYIVRVKTTDNLYFDNSDIFSITDPPATTITSQMNINTRIPQTSITLEPRPNLKLQNDMDGWMPGKCNYWKFAVDIKNVGNAAAQNIPFRFEINGPAGTAFDNFVRNGTLSSCLTIAPDATCKFARTYQINEPGTYYYTFKIDPDNTNNLYKKVTGQFVQQRPDLIVHISSSAFAALAFKRDVRFYVKNQGRACSKPSVLRTYIKQKGVKTYNIPHLRPGDIYLIKRTVKWFTLGSKKVTTAADYTNTVGEGQFENNNTDERSILVQSVFASTPTGSFHPPPAGFFDGIIINK